MKTARGQTAGPPDHSPEVKRLRARLAEATETLRAIRTGEVDTVLVTGKRGPQVFTLQGEEHAYRALIESMNEGALTLTDDKTILYANHSFARMVRCPLEQVIGSSFRRFLSVEERVSVRSLFKRGGKSGAKLQVRLTASDGSTLPVQISVRPLTKDDFNHATNAMVVTDMTEAKRTEGLLRELTQRVVQVQEAERADVALELHDHITQLLCAALFRCQTLVDKLSAKAGPSLREAVQLRDLLGEAAKEVERISRNLRPSALDHLGLGAVLSAATTEFTERTGVTVSLNCLPLFERLPADIELALYRIFQEALKNVERHARARHVELKLSHADGAAQLAITDDGVGFDPQRQSAKKKKSFGLLSMRERATYVGGALSVTSARRKGTTITVRIPLPPTDPRKN